MSKLRVSDDLLSSIMPSHLLLQQIPDMVFMMSTLSGQEFRYQLMNTAAMRASGLNDYAYGATFQDVVEPAEAYFLHVQYMECFTERKPVSFILNHDGQIGESIISPICDKNGRVAFLLGIVRDITERVERETHLEYLAFRDQLTGLFNRHALSARLNDAIRQTSANQQILVAYLLDCDNLKLTNDTYGHLTGDALLKEVASRLQQNMPAAHTIARIGGDEFLALVPLDDAYHMIEFGNRILSCMSDPWLHGNRFLNIGISIGSTICPKNASLTDIIALADKKLYEAKKSGGHRYIF